MNGSMNHSANPNIPEKIGVRTIWKLGTRAFRIHFVNLFKANMLVSGSIALLFGTSAVANLADSSTPAVALMAIAISFACMLVAGSPWLVAGLATAFATRRRVTMKALAALFYVSIVNGMAVLIGAGVFGLIVFIVHAYNPTVAPLMMSEEIGYSDAARMSKARTTSMFGRLFFASWGAHAAYILGFAMLSVVVGIMGSGVLGEEFSGGLALATASLGVFIYPMYIGSMQIGLFALTSEIANEQNARAAGDPMSPTASMDGYV